MNQSMNIKALGPHGLPRVNHTLMILQFCKSVNLFFISLKLYKEFIINFHLET